jgi:ATP-dependent DNA helicase 2 subunit 1
MVKIKGLRSPGMSLIGFKPRRLIKSYHSLRSSYFLYPDDGHVAGSSQFFDGLIDELIESEQVAIISVMSRVNQDLRFAALFPQQ